MARTTETASSRAGAPRPRGGGARDVLGDFDALYRHEWATLVALGWSLTGNWSVAEELAQDAFTDAFRRWPEVADLDRPGAWVRRAVIHRAASPHRHRGVEHRGLALVDARTGVDTDAATADRTADHALDAIGDPAFWAALRSLPRRQQVCLALDYIEDQAVADIADIADIADVVGCRPATVRVHLYRGRAALARRLGIDHPTTVPHTTDPTHPAPRPSPRSTHDGPRDRPRPHRPPRPPGLGRRRRPPPSGRRPSSPGLRGGDSAPFRPPRRPAGRRAANGPHCRRRHPRRRHCGRALLVARDGAPTEIATATSVEPSPGATVPGATDAPPTVGAGDDPASGALIAEGAFSDGTPWVLRHSTAPSTGLDLIVGEPAVYGVVETLLTSPGEPGPFVSIANVTSEGRMYAFGEIDGAAGVEVRRSDGSVLATAELVTGAGVMAWVAEIPEVPAELVALDSGGAELFRVGVDDFDLEITDGP